MKRASVSSRIPEASMSTSSSGSDDEHSLPGRASVQPSATTRTLCKGTQMPSIKLQQIEDPDERAQALSKGTQMPSIKVRQRLSAAGSSISSSSRQQSAAETTTNGSRRTSNSSSSDQPAAVSPVKLRSHRLWKERVSVASPRERARQEVTSALQSSLQAAPKHASSDPSPPGLQSAVPAHYNTFVLPNKRLGATQDTPAASLIDMQSDTFTIHAGADEDHDAASGPPAKRTQPGPGQLRNHRLWQARQSAATPASRGAARVDMALVDAWQHSRVDQAVEDDDSFGESQQASGAARARARRERLSVSTPLQQLPLRQQAASSKAAPYDVPARISGPATGSGPQYAIAGLKTHCDNDSSRQAQVVHTHPGEHLQQLDEQLPVPRAAAKRAHATRPATAGKPVQANTAGMQFASVLEAEKDQSTAVGQEISSQDASSEHSDWTGVVVTSARQLCQHRLWRERQTNASPEARAAAQVQDVLSGWMAPQNNPGSKPTAASAMPGRPAGVPVALEATFHQAFVQDSCKDPPAPIPARRLGSDQQHVARMRAAAYQEKQREEGAGQSIAGSQATGSGYGSDAPADMQQLQQHRLWKERESGASPEARAAVQVQDVLCVWAASQDFGGTMFSAGSRADNATVIFREQVEPPAATGRAVATVGLSPQQGQQCKPAGSALKPPLPPSGMKPTSSRQRQTAATGMTSQDKADRDLSLQQLQPQQGAEHGNLGGWTQHNTMQRIDSHRSSSHSSEAEGDVHKLQQHRLWKERQSCASPDARAAAQVQEEFAGWAASQEFGSGQPLTGMPGEHVARPYTNPSHQGFQQHKMLQPAVTSIEDGRGQYMMNAVRSIRQQSTDAVTPVARLAHNTQHVGSQQHACAATDASFADLAAQQHGQSAHSSEAGVEMDQLREHRLWQQRQSAASPEARAAAQVHDVLSGWAEAGQYHDSSTLYPPATTVPRAAAAAAAAAAVAPVPVLHQLPQHMRTAIRPEQQQTVHGAQTVLGRGEAVSWQPATAKPSTGQAVLHDGRRQQHAAASAAVHAGPSEAAIWLQAASEQGSEVGMDVQHLRQHRLWQERQSAASPEARAAAQVQGVLSGWLGSHDHMDILPGGATATTGPAATAVTPALHGARQQHMPEQVQQQRLIPPAAAQHGPELTMQQRAGSESRHAAAGAGYPHSNMHHMIGTIADSSKTGPRPTEHLISRSEAHSASSQPALQHQVSKASSSHSSEAAVDVQQLQQHKLWKERQSSASPDARAAAQVRDVLSAWAGGQGFGDMLPASVAGSAMTGQVGSSGFQAMPLPGLRAQRPVTAAEQPAQTQGMQPVGATQHQQHAIANMVMPSQPLPHGYQQQYDRQASRQVVMPSYGSQPVVLKPLGSHASSDSGVDVQQLQQHRLWKERESSASPDARAAARVQEVFSDWCSYQQMGSCPEAAPVVASKATGGSTAPRLQDSAHPQVRAQHVLRPAQQQEAMVHAQQTTRPQPATASTAATSGQPQPNGSAMLHTSVAQPRGHRDSGHSSESGVDLQQLQQHWMWKERESSASPKARAQAQMQETLSGWVGHYNDSSNTPSAYQPQGSMPSASYAHASTPISQEPSSQSFRGVHQGWPVNAAVQPGAMGLPLQQQLLAQGGLAAPSEMLASVQDAWYGQALHTPVLIPPHHSQAEHAAQSGIASYQAADTTSAMTGPLGDSNTTIAAGLYHPPQLQPTQTGLFTMAGQAPSPLQAAARALTPTEQRPAAASAAGASTSPSHMLRSPISEPGTSLMGVSVQAGTDVQLGRLYTLALGTQGQLLLQPVLPPASPPVPVPYAVPYAGATAPTASNAATPRSLSTAGVAAVQQQAAALAQAVRSPSISLPPDTEQQAVEPAGQQDVQVHSSMPLELMAADSAVGHAAPLSQQQQEQGEQENERDQGQVVVGRQEQLVGSAHQPPLLQPCVIADSHAFAVAPLSEHEPLLARAPASSGGDNEQLQLPDGVLQPQQMVVVPEGEQDGQQQQQQHEHEEQSSGEAELRLEHLYSQQLQQEQSSGAQAQDKLHALLQQQHTDEHRAEVAAQYQNKSQQLLSQQQDSCLESEEQQQQQQQQQQSLTSADLQLSTAPQPLLQHHIKAVEAIQVSEDCMVPPDSGQHETNSEEDFALDCTLHVPATFQPMSAGLDLSHRAPTTAAAPAAGEVDFQQDVTYESATQHTSLPNELSYSSSADMPRNEVQLIVDDSKAEVHSALDTVQDTSEGLPAVIHHDFQSFVRHGVGAEEVLQSQRNHSLAGSEQYGLLPVGAPYDGIQHTTAQGPAGAGEAAVSQLMQAQVEPTEMDAASADSWHSPGAAGTPHTQAVDALAAGSDMALPRSSLTQLTGPLVLPEPDDELRSILSPHRSGHLLALQQPSTWLRDSTVLQPSLPHSTLQPEEKCIGDSWSTLYQHPSTLQPEEPCTADTDSEEPNGPRLDYLPIVNITEQLQYVMDRLRQQLPSPSTSCTSTPRKTLGAGLRSHSCSPGRPTASSPSRLSPWVHDMLSAAAGRASPPAGPSPLPEPTVQQGAYSTHTFMSGPTQQLPPQPALAQQAATQQVGHKMYGSSMLVHSQAAGQVWLSDAAPALASTAHNGTHHGSMDTVSGVPLMTASRWDVASTTMGVRTTTSPRHLHQESAAASQGLAAKTGRLAAAANMGGVTELDSRVGVSGNSPAAKYHTVAPQVSAGLANTKARVVQVFPDSAATDGAQSLADVGADAARLLKQHSSRGQMAGIMMAIGPMRSPSSKATAVKSSAAQPVASSMQAEPASGQGLYTASRQGISTSPAHVLVSSSARPGAGTASRSQSLVRLGVDDLLRSPSVATASRGTSVQRLLTPRLQDEHHVLDTITNAMPAVQESEGCLFATVQEPHKGSDSLQPQKDVSPATQAVTLSLAQGGRQTHGSLGKLASMVPTQDDVINGIFSSLDDFNHASAADGSGPVTGVVVVARTPVPISSAVPSAAVASSDTIMLAGSEQAHETEASTLGEAGPARGVALQSAAAADQAADTMAAWRPSAADKAGATIAADRSSMPKCMVPPVQQNAAASLRIDSSQLADTTGTGMQARQPVIPPKQLRLRLPQPAALLRDKASTVVETPPLAHMNVQSAAGLVSAATQPQLTVTEYSTPPATNHQPVQPAPASAASTVATQSSIPSRVLKPSHVVSPLKLGAVLQPIKSVAARRRSQDITKLTESSTPVPKADQATMQAGVSGLQQPEDATPPMTNAQMQHTQVPHTLQPAVFAQEAAALLLPSPAPNHLSQLAAQQSQPHQQQHQHPAVIQCSVQHSTASAVRPCNMDSCSQQCSYDSSAPVPRTLMSALDLGASLELCSTPAEQVTRQGPRLYQASIDIQPGACSSALQHDASNGGLQGLLSAARGAAHGAEGLGVFKSCESLLQWAMGTEPGPATVHAVQQQVTDQWRMEETSHPAGPHQLCEHVTQHVMCDTDGDDGDDGSDSSVTSPHPVMPLQMPAVCDDGVPWAPHLTQQHLRQLQQLQQSVVITTSLPPGLGTADLDGKSSKAQYISMTGQQQLATTPPATQQLLRDALTAAREVLEAPATTKPAHRLSGLPAARSVTSHSSHSNSSLTSLQDVSVGRQYSPVDQPSSYLMRDGGDVSSRPPASTSMQLWNNPAFSEAHSVPAALPGSPASVSSRLPVAAALDHHVQSPASGAAELHTGLQLVGVPLTHTLGWVVGAGARYDSVQDSIAVQDDAASLTSFALLSVHQADLTSVHQQDPLSVRQTMRTPLQQTDLISVQQKDIPVQQMSLDLVQHAGSKLPSTPSLISFPLQQPSAVTGRRGSTEQAAKRVKTAATGHAPSTMPDPVLPALRTPASLSLRDHVSARWMQPAHPPSAVDSVSITPAARPSSTHATAGLHPQLPSCLLPAESRHQAGGSSTTSAAAAAAGDDMRRASHMECSSRHCGSASYALQLPAISSPAHGRKGTQLTQSPCQQAATAANQFDDLLQTCDSQAGVQACVHAEAVGIMGTRGSEVEQAGSAAAAMDAVHQSSIVGKVTSTLLDDDVIYDISPIPHIRSRRAAVAAAGSNMQPGHSLPTNLFVGLRSDTEHLQEQNARSSTTQLLQRLSSMQRTTRQVLGGGL